jgi:hypothetical protein
MTFEDAGDERRRQELGMGVVDIDATRDVIAHQLDVAGASGVEHLFPVSTIHLFLLAAPRMLHL